MPQLIVLPIQAIQAAVLGVQPQATVEAEEAVARQSLKYCLDSGISSIMKSALSVEMLMSNG